MDARRKSSAIQILKQNYKRQNKRGKREMVGGSRRIRVHKKKEITGTRKRLDKVCRRHIRK